MHIMFELNHQLAKYVFLLIKANQVELNREGQIVEGQIARVELLRVKIVRVESARVELQGSNRIKIDSVGHGI
jgi:hypothetical protein